jgi:hypothetical protein
MDRDPEHFIQIRVRVGVNREDRAALSFRQITNGKAAEACLARAALACYCY